MKFSDIKIGMKLKFIKKRINYYDDLNIGDVLIVYKDRTNVDRESFSLFSLTKIGLEDNEEIQFYVDKELEGFWEPVNQSLKELME